MNVDSETICLRLLIIGLIVLLRLWVIGVARIFDWGGGPNRKSHAMTSSETSKEEFFVGAKIS